LSKQIGSDYADENASLFVFGTVHKPIVILFKNSNEHADEPDTVAKVLVFVDGVLEAQRETAVSFFELQPFPVHGGFVFGVVLVDPEAEEVHEVVSESETRVAEFGVELTGVALQLEDHHVHQQERPDSALEGFTELSLAQEDLQHNHQLLQLGELLFEPQGGLHALDSVDLVGRYVNFDPADLVDLLDQRHVGFLD